VTVTYSDGTARTVTDYLLTVGEMDDGGDSTVTLSYCGKTAQFTIHTDAAAFTCDMDGTTVSYSVTGAIVPGEQVLCARYVDGRFVDCLTVQITETTRTGSLTFNAAVENARYVLFLLSGDNIALADRQEPDKPRELTWSEYQALTPAEKEAYYRTFATAQDFFDWRTRAQAAEQSGGSGGTTVIDSGGTIDVNNP